MNKYYSSALKEVGLAFEPSANRYLKALQRRGWLPLLRSTNTNRLFQNYILCEAHRDKVKYYFDSNDIK